MTDLFNQLCGDLLNEPDPGVLHDRLRERQDQVDAVVSEIKVRRAELLAQMHDDGKPLAEIAKERGFGTYQRVQKLLAQTADERAKRQA